jgi:hypothetical protein
MSMARLRGGFSTLQIHNWNLTCVAKTMSLISAQLLSDQRGPRRSLKAAESRPFGNIGMAVSWRAAEPFDASIDPPAKLPKDFRLEG